jgi:hypothetical protein
VQVLVTVREVFQERKQRCLVCVIGESARSDYMQMIDASEIEEGESWEEERCCMARRYARLSHVE